MTALRALLARWAPRPVPPARPTLAARRLSDAGLAALWPTTTDHPESAA